MRAAVSLKRGLNAAHGSGYQVSLPGQVVPSVGARAASSSSTPPASTTTSRSSSAAASSGARRAGAEGLGVRTGASSSSSSSSSSSMPKTPKTLIAPTLLVGPPDPLSNLRPVRYVSVLEQGAGEGSAGSRRGAGAGARGAGGPGGRMGMVQEHPYSVSEFSPASSSTSFFSSSSSSSSSSSRGAAFLTAHGSRWQASRANTLQSDDGASATSDSHPFPTTPDTTTAHIDPSPTYTRLLARLEEASLAHRLRTARASAFDQRFWADNNVRFGRDRAGALEAAGGGASQAQAGSASTGIQPDPTPDEKEADNATASFYRAWLSANASRHRAYNRVLVRRTLADLAPEARFRALLGWVRVVGWWERVVRVPLLRMLGYGRPARTSTRRRVEARR